MAQTFTRDADQIADAKKAHAALAAAKTKKDVQNIWDAHLGTLGHRILGRLLCGSTVNEALRIKKEAK